MTIDNVPIEIPKATMDTWQEMVDILAKIFDIPACLIMRLRDPDIEVFVSSRSEGNPYHPGDKEHFLGSGLYCETVINSQGRLLVPDALADAHWQDNPDVRLNMVSYLGFPLFLPDGEPFGTICVLDRKRNEYSQMTEQLMLKFKDIIESHLELLAMNQILGDKNKRLTDYLMEIQAFRGMVPICSGCKAIRDQAGEWHPIEHYLLTHPEASFTHGLCPKCVVRLYPDLGQDV